MKKTPKIIAIDGPAGSGKSTAALRVSQEMKWDYLNTSTLYRLIGYLADQKGLSLDTDEGLEQLIESCTPDIEWKKGIFYYLGKEVPHALHKERTGMLASKVARFAVVRTLLLPLQRKLALLAENGVVIDGRDIGTVVFPNADLKIFMIADLQTRAERRYKQLKEKEFTPLPTIQDLMKEMKRRDEQDSQRSHAPLVKASDAIEMDTSSLSIEDCVLRIVQMIKILQ